MEYEMTSLVNNDAFPYRSVCCIQVRFGDQWYTGSGVLVGRNDVLTASHVIYDAALGGLADEIIVMPSFDADYFRTYGVNDDRAYQSVWNEYYTDFDPDGDGLLPPGDGGSGFAGTERDIALITLGEAAGDVFGWMNIDYGFSAGTVNVSGHPSAQDNRSTNAVGYTAADSIDWVFPISQFDVSPGNSGGPLWYQGASGPTVIGVVSTTGWAVDVAAHNWLASAINANNHYMAGSPPPATGISLEDAQRIALLYEAGLDRQAEDAGLNYWIDQLEAGRSFASMAQFFMESSEFRASFGDPSRLSNDGFVDLLYKNVLGRDGEADGFQYWLGQLANGVSRNQMLLGFAVSPENEAGSPYVQSLFEDNSGNWHFG
ncbi:MAG TPA: DUF4214 domain-containing protein [Ramlibacter sp.]|jgi:V8-like Glu-specific endopeptidase